LDHGEDIEVSSRPLGEIPGIIASGGIDHALVMCAFWWLAQKHPSQFGLHGTPLTLRRLNAQIRDC
jgi:hypothetical protein